MRQEEKIEQQFSRYGERRGCGMVFCSLLSAHPDVTAFATDGYAKSPLYLGSSAIFD